MQHSNMGLWKSKIETCMFQGPKPIKEKKTENKKREGVQVLGPRKVQCVLGSNS